MGLDRRARARKAVTARDWDLLKRRMDEIKSDALPVYKKELARLMASGTLSVKECLLMERARIDWRMWLKLEAQKKRENDEEPYYIWMNVGACCKEKKKKGEAPDCKHRVLVTPGWMEREETTEQYAMRLRGVFSMVGLAGCHLVAHSNGT